MIGADLLNILSSVLGNYLGLKADDYKKRIISGLTIGFSRVLSTFLIIMLLMIVLAI